jgi:hypothetical protein
MRLRNLFLALACCSACSYDPPGRCTLDGDCTIGTVCQASVCVTCPGGICPASRVIQNPGDSLTLFLTPYSADQSLTATFGAGVVPPGTLVSMKHAVMDGLPPFTGGTVITSLELTAAGVTQFKKPLRISGMGLTALKSSTVLIVAQLRGSAWVDVVTAITVGNGALKTLRSSALLPGILAPGTFIIYQPTPGTSTAVADFGLALVGDDGNSGNPGLQVISLYDDDGSPLAAPTMTVLGVSGAADLDGAALTPDGSQGVMVDGSNFIVFFSDLGSGYPKVSPTKLDVAIYGGDGDAIAILPTGDEAVVSADGTTRKELVIITGIVSGNPVVAATVPYAGSIDGLAISNDGRVLLGRGSGHLIVWSIDPITPRPGPLGGTISHVYTQIADFGGWSFGSGDGRNGMVLSPTDSSRAVVVGYASGPVAQLLTGLPGTVAAPPTARPQVSITGAAAGYAVAITPDGKKAIVGTDAGLVMFTGIDTGTLVQSGPPFNPSYIVGATSFTLSQGGVPTLGITLDGLYVIAMSQPVSAKSGTLLTIPIQGNGFAPPIGQLNGVAVPNNDQIMMH